MICFKPKSEKSCLDVNLDIKLYSCGTGDCECNFSWGPGIRDHYSLYYVHNGKGRVIMNGITYEVTQGEGFLVSPNTVISYGPDTENPWDYYWVSFNGLHAETYLNRLNLNVKQPLFKCNNQQVFTQCFKGIFESIHYESSMDLHALSGFYLLLANIAEYTDGAVTYDEMPSQQEHYIRQAIEFIETNYSRKITIEEIASYVGINRKYLTKLFNLLLNESPQNYLVQFRLSKASELLHHSSLTISEIAHSIGYTDALVFSKVFKKFKNLSPKAYRDLSLQ
ncbi:MAG: AraC family transcriptional regulator [Clostridia bacterium]|jgi:AraC-like DNA-binding protein|nr:AraC family transcriptional regulator [Clostridia bacterium]